VKKWLQAPCFVGMNFQEFLTCFLELLEVSFHPVSPPISLRLRLTSFAGSPRWDLAFCSFYLFRLRLISFLPSQVRILTVLSPDGRFEYFPFKPFFLPNHFFLKPGDHPAKPSYYDSAPPFFSLSGVRGYLFHLALLPFTPHFFPRSLPSDPHFSLCGQAPSSFPDYWERTYES